MNRGKLPRSAFKLVVFVVVCALVGVLVVNTLRDPVAGETSSYHAVFSNAEGLEPGSEVRVAGVRVGTVGSVALRDGKAHVSFRVREAQRVPAGVRARIQYADLLGARYLSLRPRESDGTAGRRLDPGSTIPDSRTSPALDLTALLNGFKPLFEAIDPGQVNKLARQIVSVLQGEGGTITSLLRRVVSLTSTLRSRDAVIGQVITNLNRVLGTVSTHGDDLKRLVGALGKLTHDLAGNRELIATALDSGGKLASTLADLLADIEPDVSNSVAALRDISGTLVRNQRKLENVLGRAPAFLRTMNRTLDYGSWVNVYVCGLAIRVAGRPVDLGAGPHSKVCR